MDTTNQRSSVLHEQVQTLWTMRQHLSLSENDFSAFSFKFLFWYLLVFGFSSFSSFWRQGFEGIYDMPFWKVCLFFLVVFLRNYTWFLSTLDTHPPFSASDIYLGFNDSIWDWNPFSLLFQSQSRWFTYPLLNLSRTYE